MSTERLALVLMIVIVLLGFQSCLKSSGSLSEAKHESPKRGF